MITDNFYKTNFFLLRVNFFFLINNLYLQHRRQELM